MKARIATIAARLSTPSRVLAGTLGAYGVTSLATAALSLSLVRLGTTRVEAVTAATLASFLIFAVIAMAVFHARSATRGWAGLGGGAVVCGVIWLLAGGGG